MHVCFRRCMNGAVKQGISVSMQDALQGSWSHLGIADHKTCLSNSSLTPILKIAAWAKHIQPAISALFPTGYNLSRGELCFLTPIHHSWSFLSLLCEVSPHPLRSHSTAAALLYNRATARAIKGRRGKVAQLTLLIPRSQSSAVLFKSLHCWS